MAKIIDRVYGPFEVENVISELLATPSVQRLGRIHQSGAAFIPFPHADSSRLEHSLGTVRIVQLLGGYLKEQVAALLHDISHGAFSHVGPRNEFFYRDDILQVLRRHDIDPDEIYHEENWPLLEAPLPDLCADRIDYTLRDYVIWAERPREHVEKFLANLRFLDGKVVIADRESAVWFKTFFDELNRDFFRHPLNLAASQFLVDLLRRALETEVLRKEDLMTDDESILEKIQQSYLEEEFGTDAFLRFLDANEDCPPIQIKDRVVNPLVLTTSGIARLI